MDERLSRPHFRERLLRIRVFDFLNNLFLVVVVCSVQDAKRLLLHKYF